MAAPLRMLALCVLLAGACTSADAVTANDPARVPPGVVYESFHSTALRGTEHLAVYLPAGYSATRLHYPVIYLLHGLPAGPTAYQMERTAEIGEDARRDRRPAIVVAPQGARRGDDDPEWHDWGPGRDWATAATQEVVHFVDGHFRTIRSRTGRAVVGFSAGGYGAMILGIQHPDEYSVIQSWSGYYHPTNRDGTRPLDVGSKDANDQADVRTYVSRLERMVDEHRPLRIAFYVGEQDTTFLRYNEELHRELLAAHVPHVYATYPGGHGDAIWDANERTWVGAAVDAMTPAH
jgi:putative tributyrin esterase